eukprot:PhF_6_TR25125/c0_g1_i4/m.34564
MNHILLYFQSHMLSLIQSEPYKIQLLPSDCIGHIISFCPPSIASTCYLVCRSWYHAVDRYVCLGDTFYYLPESFVTEENHHGVFPSDLLHTLQDDIRWQHTRSFQLNMDNKSESMLSTCFTMCRDL